VTVSDGQLAWISSSRPCKVRVALDAGRTKNTAVSDARYRSSKTAPRITSAVFG